MAAPQMSAYVWMHTDIVIHLNLLLSVTVKDIHKLNPEVVTSIPNTWVVDAGRSGVQTILGCVWSLRSVSKTACTPHPHQTEAKEIQNTQ